MALVRKVANKLHMCMDFTNLNATCPKDLYPFPNIEHVIDGSLGYRMLSFTDTYYGYNQIWIDPLDDLKMAFMSNHDNYDYISMPFGLKNSSSTYQRLIDLMFSHQIRENLEVYVDDMIIKTFEECSHTVDLEDILQFVKKYNIRLNIAKFSFGVQAGKFIGFMLKKRVIEFNPYKCMAVIKMRNPSLMSRKYNNLQVVLPSYLASSLVRARRISSSFPP